MSALRLSPDVLAAVRGHGERSYPEECCGFLLGRAGADGGVAVERVLPADNERPDRRVDRYVIGPERVLEVHHQARAAGLDVVGYYHSHPDHLAEPSDFDREHAWPGVSYLIVAVHGGRAGETRSWRLTDDRAGFAEQPVAAVTPPIPEESERA